MTRSKVELSFIANNVARKVSFKKRSVGLLKKVDELSTLCGVDTCVIISSPYDPAPVVWPNQERAKRVVDNFLDLPDVDQNRKMMDQATYLNERISKSTQRLARLQDDNFQYEMALMLYETVAGGKSLDDINPIDLNNLLVMIDRNVADINRRLQVPDLYAPPRNLMPLPLDGGVGSEQGLGGARGMGVALRTYEAGSSSSATVSGGGHL